VKSGNRETLSELGTLALPEYTTRYSLKQVLLRTLGDTEETAHLVDYLLDAWEIFDLLTERFDVETARRILMTPPCCMEVVPS
jgi:hypothetical protein